MYLHLSLVDGHVEVIEYKLLVGSSSIALNWMDDQWKYCANLQLRKNLNWRNFQREMILRASFQY